MLNLCLIPIRKLENYFFMYVTQTSGRRRKGPLIEERRSRNLIFFFNFRKKHEKVVIDWREGRQHGGCLKPSICWIPFVTHTNFDSGWFQAVSTCRYNQLYCHQFSLSTFATSYDFWVLFVTPMQGRFMAPSVFIWHSFCLGHENLAFSYKTKLGLCRRPLFFFHIKLCVT